ncbi:MAG TPA: amidase family protein [Kofleriaceae bacterium]|jgi:amidase|nr:amidase family protein [Kofleriaceae bacterium]
MRRALFGLVAVLAIATFVRRAPADDHDDGDDRGRDRLQLVEATIPQLDQALRSHLITSRQLVEMYQARIAAYDKVGPTLNAFIHLNPNAAAEGAARDHQRDDDDRGPMFGIPILLKDNVDTRDQPTTAGSISLAGSVPPHDSFITRRLRDAGAVILGKATLTEFANFIANGMPSGYSSLGGYGLNPFDPRPLPGGDGRPVLTPGGSSSGPGIAVSANMVTIAIGTETSGSILSPSTANGDVGIKPTLGLVSRTGILPITANQDTAGPIARTVTDAAILLGVIAGFDRDDPATLPCLVPGNCFRNYTRFLDKHALKGARIAVPHVPYWNGFTADQTAIMNEVIGELRAAGAFVDDGHELPNQADISAFGICTSAPAPTNCSTVLMYGQKHDLNAYLTRRPNAPMHTIDDIIAFNNANPVAGLKYGQALFLAAATLDTSPGSADTQRVAADRTLDLQLTRTGLDGVLDGPDGIAGTDDDFDAILFPQNRGAAAPAKAGYPSVAVPTRFQAPVAPVVNPAPFGVAFTGRAFSEPRLIALAFAYEQATHHRTPPASAPALPSDTVTRDRHGHGHGDRDGDHGHR